MDPIDDALQAMEKSAALLPSFVTRAAGNFARGVNNTVQPSKNMVQDVAENAGRKFTADITTGAANALGAGTIAGVGLGINHLVQAAAKTRQFNQMLEVNPDLQDHRETNPRFFNTAYNSLRSLNPVFGKDPVVSGSIMRRMMETPESAGGILMSTLKTPDIDGGLGVRADLRAGPFSVSKDLF